MVLPIYQTLKGLKLTEMNNENIRLVCQAIPKLNQQDKELVYALILDYAKTKNVKGVPYGIKNIGGGPMINFDRLPKELQKVVFNVGMISLNGSEKANE